jgi:hypothetical protein
VPDGFPGFEVPVEKLYPCLVPFLELPDGRTIAAVDGADDIEPAADGKSVSAVWKRWVVVGAKAAVFVDPGLVSEVTWTLQGDTLQRSESLTTSRPLDVRRLWFAIPSRYDHLETSYLQGTRVDRLMSEGKSFEIQVKNSNLPLDISAYAAGNDPLGRGDRGPLPMHLIFQAENFLLTPAKPTYWELSLTRY